MPADLFSSYFFYLILAGISLSLGWRFFLQSIVAGSATYLILLSIRSLTTSQWEPSIAVGLTAAMLFPLLQESSVRKKYSAFSFWVVIMIIFVQRLVSGRHNLTEVLAGLLIGVVIAAIVRRWLWPRRFPAEAVNPESNTWPETVLIPPGLISSWSRAEVAERYPGVVTPLFSEIFLPTIGRAVQKMGRHLDIRKDRTITGYSLSGGYIFSNLSLAILRPVKLISRIIRLGEKYLEYYENEYRDAKKKFWASDAEIKLLLEQPADLIVLRDALTRATGLFEDWMFQQSVSLFYYTFTMTYLRTMLKIHFPRNSKSIFSDLMKGLGGPSWEETKLLFELGKAQPPPSASMQSTRESDTLLDSYIKLAGDKFPSYDFIEAPLGEFPDAIIQLAISTYREDRNLNDELQQQISERLIAEKRLARRFKETHLLGSRFSEKFLKITRTIGPFKEERQRQMGAAWGNVRRILKKIGDHYMAEGLLRQTDDVFFLTAAELAWLLRGGAGNSPNPDLKTLGDLAPSARLRKNRFQQLKRVSSEVTFSGRKAVIEFSLGNFFSRSKGKTPGRSNELKGSYGIGRVVEGKAVVIENPSQFGTMKKGQILIAPATNPHWDILFSLASGLVTETGSPLSHPFIKANEYGIPAILGVEQACRKIKTGDKIRIDGQKKSVTIIYDLRQNTLRLCAGMNGG